MHKVKAHPSTRLPDDVTRGEPYSNAQGESGWYLRGAMFDDRKVVLIAREDFDDDFKAEKELAEELFAIADGDYDMPF